MSEIRVTSATVVGSGPNGLAAAITLARAGLPVTVFEKNKVAGGACRSTELIKPGYTHDIGSAVHPLAVSSPFFHELSLEDYGLNWIVPGIALAHPFDDGTAVLLKRSVQDTASTFDNIDSKSYQQLMDPLVNQSKLITSEVLNFPRLPVRHPYSMLNFGRYALHSAVGLAVGRFEGARARAFIAGLGVHSVMNLEQRASAAAGLLLAVAGHIYGWPLPEGGSQKITDALVKCLYQLGGIIETEKEIKSIIKYPSDNILFLDVTPQQFLDITEGQLPVAYKRKLDNYRYGPGVFKMDWILDGPVPWQAVECASAGTVHIGGYIEEIVASEKEIHGGRHPEKPFVLLVQPTLFDQSRVKGSGHIVWGYCHVPNSSQFNMSDRIEAQIERFAPGFKERIIARNAMYPLDIEKDNPNCVGGDIAAGAQSLSKIVFPNISYRTPLDNVFLCSAATPPGPGVHGMCGFRAVQFALRKRKLI